jgi:hypothetical protein
MKRERDEGGNVGKRKRENVLEKGRTEKEGRKRKKRRKSKKI